MTTIALHSNSFGPLVSTNATIRNPDVAQPASVVKNTLAKFALRHPREAIAISAAKSGKLFLLKLCLASGISPNTVNKEGLSLLQLAALHGHDNLIPLLAEKGVDMDQVNAEGNTPLHIAAKNGSLKLLEALSNAGVDFDFINDEKETALHISAQEGHADCVGLLLRSGCNARLKDDEGDTPLHLAAYEGNLEAIDLLMNTYSLACLMSNDDGKIPAHLACVEGHFEAYQRLLPTSPSSQNTIFQDKDGDTMLHDAVRSGNKEIARDLITRYGLPLLDAINNNGETALYVAAKEGNLDMYRYLVERGADPTIKCNKGKTPSLIGFTYGYEQFFFEMDEESRSLLALQILGHTLSTKPMDTSYMSRLAIETRLFISDYLDTRAKGRKGPRMLERGSFANVMYYPFLHSLSQSLEKNTLPYPILGRDNVEYLKEMMSLGFKDTEPNQTDLDSILSGKPYFIKAGWDAHETPICICGEYLAIGNTGEGSGKNKSLKVFKIDPNKVTIELLIEIQNKRSASYADGEEFLYEILPILLSTNWGIETDMKCMQLELFEPIEQEQGTCTYDGLRALMGFAWVMLSNYDFTSPQELLPILREANHFINDTAWGSWKLLGSAIHDSPIEIPLHIQEDMEEKALEAKGRRSEYFNRLAFLEQKYTEIS